MRDTSAPSPLRSGLLHFTAGLALFSAAGAAGAGLVSLTGDEADAGPVVAVALFEETEAAPGTAPDAAPLTSWADADPALTGAPQERADLGVDYPAAVPPNARQPALASARVLPSTPSSVAVPVRESSSVESASQTGASKAGSVRINGKVVNVGQSFSGAAAADVPAEPEPDPALPMAVDLPRAPLPGLHSGRLPVIADNGRTVSQAYARPFENPDGKPTVSIIVGGLGINAGQTRSAIRDLPPEVTLSFVSVPRERGPSLQRWLREAREAGHEVMIEMPMQPLDYGRKKPMPSTLQAGLGAAANTGRLEAVMAKATGFFALTNYQGDRFARNSEDTRPVLQALAARGVGFIEDGSLSRSTLPAAAADAGMAFATADRVIDASTAATDIEWELAELEVEARENGAALGTAFNFPVTVDTVKAWTETLDAKGLVLAPASAVLSPGGVRAAGADALSETAAMPGDLLPGMVRSEGG